MSRKNPVYTSNDTLSEFYFHIVLIYVSINVSDFCSYCFGFFRLENIDILKILVIRRYLST